MIKIFAFIAVCVGVMASASAWAAEGKSLPAAGSPAPEFDLTNDLGEGTKLADLRGKWVVLYFYPRDFTSGCTVEAQNFQRDLAEYGELGAVILGVSTDSADSHKEFYDKEKLAFRLLSDPDAHTSAAYGSVMQHEGTTMSARNTFIIDPQGKIAQVFAGVKPTEHSAEVLDALARLQNRGAAK